MTNERYIVELGQLGKNIKRYRKIRNMIQLDLAEAMNIERSEISKIENGKINIEFRTIVRLADALNITTKDLFDFDDEKKQ